MTVRIDLTEEANLQSIDYYERLDWHDFLSLASQAYLKLKTAKNDKWNRVTVTMSDFAYTKVPSFMYHQYIETAVGVLTN